MKISIITVVYNNYQTIEHTILSVFGQTYSDIEYIVVDGGSTDGTLDIINKYKDKISVIISEKDEGIYDAMNKGIKLATGMVIGTLNADDMFYDTNVLVDVANVFDENKVVCCYGNLIYVDRVDTEKITRRWISRQFEEGLFSKSWTPAHPTFYCKREMFERYGYYRLDFEIAADVELMYRFIQKHRITSKYIPRMMVKMRNAGISNQGLKSTITITREMKKAIVENGGRFNLIKYLFYKGFKIIQFIKRK
ncbi:MAG: glycosyltransferase [Candidatus Margulisiibacteriota bacterium]|nr:MAG: glycosyltransferase [Candidatus Margulisiibacteriota bacterium]